MAANTYQPENPPEGLPPGLGDYLKREFLRISAAFDDPRTLVLDPTTATPTKPREGQIRLADGSGWNPGAGAGYYGYYGGAWVKLG